MSKKLPKKSPKSASSARPGAKTAPKPRKAEPKPRKIAPKSRKTEPKAQKASVPAKPVGKVESAPRLAEGDKAPSFRLPRDGGQAISLSDFAGRKLVLFFYPRANTPGCTTEAIGFTRLSEAFADSGTAVVGVSADSVKAQEAFRDKHKLTVPLLSDETHAMLEAFGAWGEKSMYGKTFQGIIRTTVLIGGDGIVRRIWRHVKVDGHAEAVLEAARSI